MRPILASFALLAGCAPELCYRPWHHVEMVSGYDVEPNFRVSEKFGFVIDDRKHEIDDGVLDQTVENTLRCIEGLGRLTEEERRAAWCTGEVVPEIRSCLVIKAAPEWRYSCDGRTQVFSCNAPDASCRAKGLEPTAACPCSCRAAVQDNSILITAPNLELVPWRLTEMLTGCDQLQNVPRLAACGSPALVQAPKDHRI